MRRIDRVVDETGFTLLELLIAIAISAIVLSTITLAVAQGFSESSAAGVRVDRSNLADFTAKRFASDAASSAADQSTASPCGSGSTALDIAETDGTRVSYAVTTSSGVTGLERRVCAGASTAIATLGSTSKAFHVVGAATSCPSTPPSGVSVTCSLSVTWDNGDGDHDGEFTLTGVRRAG